MSLTARPSVEAGDLGHWLAPGTCRFVVGPTGTGKTFLLRRLGQLASGSGRPALLHSASSSSELVALLQRETCAWAAGSPLTGPPVVIVDDLHLGGSAVLAQLAETCRRPLPGVTIVVALRPWPPEALACSVDLSDAEWVEHEWLRPLSDEAAADMFSHLRPGPESRSAATAAATAAGGVPLLIYWLAKDCEPSLLSSGAWKPSPLLRRKVATRFLEPLGAARLVASEAAVLGAQFDTALLLAISAAGAPAVLEAITALLQAGLVDVSGARGRFCQPLVRSVLEAEVLPPAGAAVHARAFQTLLSWKALPGQLAEHARRCGLRGDPEVVRTLWHAGVEAARRSDFAAAAADVGAAVDLAGSEASEDMLAVLAELLITTGRADMAAECAARQERQSPTGDAGHERLLRRMAWLAFLDADGPGSLTLFEQAAASPGEPSLPTVLDHAMASLLTEGPRAASELLAGLGAPSTLTARARLDATRRLLIELMPPPAGGAEQAGSLSAVAAGRRLSGLHAADYSRLLDLIDVSNCTGDRSVLPFLMVTCEAGDPAARAAKLSPREWCTGG